MTSLIIPAVLAVFVVISLVLLGVMAFKSSFPEKLDMTPEAERVLREKLVAIARKRQKEGL